MNYGNICPVCANCQLCIAENQCEECSPGYVLQALSGTCILPNALKWWQSLILVIVGLIIVQLMGKDISI